VSSREAPGRQERQARRHTHARTHQSEAVFERLLQVVVVRLLPRLVPLAWVRVRVRVRVGVRVRVARLRDF